VTPDGTNSRYRWWVVFMLWFACFFNYADRQAIYSVFPLLKSEMGLSDVQLGIVGASFMWVYAAAGPLAGVVADRFPRKTLILAGLIFWSAVTLLTALARGYGELVLFRALEGFGEAFYFPASMALISDYHGPATRSRAMSIHQSSVYAGTVAGGGVAGYMGEMFGWRSSFYLFGILGVLLGLALMIFLREAPRGQAEPEKKAAQEPLWPSLRRLASNRVVTILIAAFIGANFVAMVFLTWMPSFLYRKFGMSLTMAGWNSTAWLQAASVLGVLSGGWLADRLARRRPGGRMAVQAAGLLLGVPFLFLTGWTLSVPLLVAAMVGFGYFKGWYDANIWASLYDVVPVERRATALGFMNSIGWLGAGFAPVAIGAASAVWGMGASISATAAIYAGVAALMFTGVARRRTAPE
jgi:MFS family permease